MKEFRNLRPDEIQIRPTDTKYKGSCTLLAYQDARAAMDILDETVGAENWQKEYYEVKGNVYCRIGVNTDNGWVWKADCGMESNVDAAKGEASDATKRAAVCWGIGRELYTIPRIKIQCPDSYYYNDKLTMTFAVSDIAYSGKEVTILTIVDKFGNVVYTYDKNRVIDPVSKPVEQNGERMVRAGGGPVDDLHFFCSQKKKEQGINKDELLKFFNFYKGKIEENGGWKGRFMADRLWKQWMNTAS